MKLRNQKKSQTCFGLNFDKINVLPILLITPQKTMSFSDSYNTQWPTMPTCENTTAR